MQVAFFKNKSFVSSTIKRFTRSPYSHCAIILDSGEVIEAREFKGVRIIKNIKEAMDEDSVVDIYDFAASDNQKMQIENFLRRQLGKGYDYLMIVGFVTRASHEGRKSTNRWFCSELVFAALENAGMVFLINLPAWKVSPGILSYSPKLTLSQRLSNFGKNVQSF